MPFRTELFQRRERCRTLADFLCPVDPACHQVNPSSFCFSVLVAFLSCYYDFVIPDIVNGTPDAVETVDGMGKIVRIPVPDKQPGTAFSFVESSGKQKYFPRWKFAYVRTVGHKVFVGLFFLRIGRTAFAENCLCVKPPVFLPGRLDNDRCLVHDIFPAPDFKAHRNGPVIKNDCRRHPVISKPVINGV